MKLNINRIVKKKLYYFFVVFSILIHFIGVNIKIFRDCWEEKWYRDPVIHWTKQTYYSFEECQKYDTITFDDLSILVYESWEGLALLCNIIFLFIIYVIIVSVLVLIKKVSFVKMLILDFITFSFFAYSLYIFFFYPRVGVIPLYIFIPLVFSILLAFRIYQYKRKLIFE